MPRLVRPLVLLKRVRRPTWAPHDGSGRHRDRHVKDAVGSARGHQHIIGHLLTGILQIAVAVPVDPHRDVGRAARGVGGCDRDGGGRALDEDRHDHAVVARVAGGRRIGLAIGLGGDGGAQHQARDDDVRRAVVRGQRAVVARSRARAGVEADRPSHSHLTTVTVTSSSKVIRDLYWVGRPSEASRVSSEVRAGAPAVMVAAAREVKVTVMVEEVAVKV